MQRPVRADLRVHTGNDYVLYTAPEQIFTAEVPASWQVQTYVDRSHPDGTIPWTGYASPDGQIVIRAPDALPGKFMMPNPYVGRYEGQRSGIFAVRGLVPAEQYASEHAQRIAQQLGCAGGRFVDRGNRPKAAQSVRESMPQAVRSSISRVHAGEAVLECQYGETSLQIFAQAVVFAMDTVQGWMASTSSMIAPPSRADEALRIRTHIDESTTMNRAWIEREFREGQRRAAEASRKAWQAQQRQRQLNAATRSTSTGTGSSSDDGGHRAFINSIHGTQDLTDRFGDTVYGVESHSTYHWQDGQGNIVGTDIDSNPNVLEYERMSPAGGGY